MSNISNKRLDELIALCEQPEYENGDTYDTAIALRELRDYRKAVREYLEAVDAPTSDGRSYEDYLISVNTAEAALRALAQPEREKP